VPGFTVQRQTYLTSNLVGAGMICLAGLGTAWLVERARTRRVWGAALVLLGIVAAGTYDWRLPPANVASLASGARVPAVYAWLADHGDRQPLLELPATLSLNAVYAYFSTRHWLPIFNGTFSYPPGYDAAMNAASTVLASQGDAAAFVRDVPIRWIVVHGALLAPVDRARVATAPAHLEEVARFGEDVVYRLRDVPSGETSATSPMMRSSRAPS
jgi:hypothetical protein